MKYYIVLYLISLTSACCARLAELRSACGLRPSAASCSSATATVKQTDTFTFAICHRPSVCLSVCRLSSVTFVHPTQAIEIGNVSTPLGTLVTRWYPGKILRRSSQGNPSIMGVVRGVAEYCDNRPIERYISRWSVGVRSSARLQQTLHITRLYSNLRPATSE